MIVNLLHKSLKCTVPILFLCLSFSKVSRVCAGTVEDSLNIIISSENSHDTAIASAYLALGEALYISNFDTLLPLSEKAEEICTNGLKNAQDRKVKVSFLKTYSGALNNIGYYYSAIGEAKTSLEYYFKALPVQQDIADYSGMSISYNNIAYVYENQGLIPEALRYYQASSDISEMIGDNNGWNISLNNLGILYKRQGDFDKSIELYEQSLALAKDEKNRRTIAIAYNNIGSVYYDKGDLEISHMYYQKSLSIRREIDDKRGVSNSYANIGKIDFEQGNLDQAEEHVRNAVKTAIELNDNPNRSQHSVLLAKILLKKGAVSEAKEIGEKAYQLAVDLGFPKYISEAAEVLSRIEQVRGNDSRALILYQDYIAMRDSILNTENQTIFAQNKARFEYEKEKAIVDAKYAGSILLEKEKNQRQSIVIYVVIAGLILLALFLVFVFYRLRITKIQKTKITLQKKEIEVKRKEILDSITYAKRIQSAILPPPGAFQQIFPKSFVLYTPKDIVAGDFYWVHSLPDYFLFAAADCTGHGVPGAMVSVVCNNGLNRSVREYGLKSPDAILNKTREIVLDEFKKSMEKVNDGMDISLCAIDLKTRMLKFSGAYNPAYIIRNKALVEIKGDKQPVGLYEKKFPFNLHEFQLQKEDMIYVFTDGFADQFGGPKGKKFKYKAFKELLIELSDSPAHVQKQELEERLLNWRGKIDQVDDVCIIGVKI